MKKIFLFALLSVAFTSLSALGRPAPEEPPKDSIYQAGSTWSLQDGRRIRLNELSGQPVLMTMAYTSCEYTCPLIVEKLRAIETAVREQGGTRYRIVIASFDPKGDRPDKLVAFMKKRKIDKPSWSMIVADDASSTRELAILLGINYKAEEGGHFSHSNVISLLDEKGRVLLQLNGLNADHAELVKAMVKENGKAK